MEDLKKLDLYALLGVSSTAKTKEVSLLKSVLIIPKIFLFPTNYHHLFISQIKTAYRKRALTCHPDKNPDDANAVKLFHQLNEALKLLTNEAERVNIGYCIL